MNFTFSTTVSIPNEKIKIILNELKENIIMNLEKSPIIKQDTLYYVQYIIDKEIVKMVASQPISMFCGYEMHNDDIAEIKKLLYNGNNINAIKIFRSKTKTSLRESSELIKDYKKLHNINIT